MGTITQWMCPWCHEVIAERSFPHSDYESVERELREHMTSRHPIRWRLSRKYRAAINISSEDFGGL